jgi:hypothetical protein
MKFQNQNQILKSNLNIMKKFSYLIAFAIVLMSLHSCVKDKVEDATAVVDPGNPISVLAGNWFTQTWGGVASNNMGVTINATNKNGTIAVIGATTFGYALGDVLLSNIAVTTTSGVFSCDYLLRNGTNSQNTPATITLQGATTMLIHITPVGGQQPADVTLMKN